MNTLWRSAQVDGRHIIQVLRTRVEDRYNPDPHHPFDFVPVSYWDKATASELLEIAAEERASVL